MMVTGTNNPNLLPVGKSNVNAVLQMIKTQKLNLVVSDVGGNFGRKILFYTHTGKSY